MQTEHEKEGKDGSILRGDVIEENATGCGVGGFSSLQLVVVLRGIRGQSMQKGWQMVVSRREGKDSRSRHPAQSP